MTRKDTLSAALAVGATAVAAISNADLAAAAEAPAMSATPEAAAIPAVHGAVGDFDFFGGSWNVRMRRRRAILRNSDEWYDLSATCSNRKIVAGFGNIDDFHMTTSTGATVSAMTLRLFDAKTCQWSIYWVATPNVVLDPSPVVGGFEHGEGLFYAADSYNDKPVLVRFLWRPGATPRWEQAFSPDAGRTWETNWTMEFDRVST
jgi:hypothetical protein